MAERKKMTKGFIVKDLRGLMVLERLLREVCVNGDNVMRMFEKALICLTKMNGCVRIITKLIIFR